MTGASATAPISWRALEATSGKVFGPRRRGGITGREADDACVADRDAGDRGGAEGVDTNSTSRPYPRMAGLSRPSRLGKLRPVRYTVLSAHPCEPAGRRDLQVGVRTTSFAEQPRASHGLRGRAHEAVRYSPAGLFRSPCHRTRCHSAREEQTCTRVKAMVRISGGNDLFDEIAAWPPPSNGMVGIGPSQQV